MASGKGAGAAVVIGLGLAFGLAMATTRKASAATPTRKAPPSGKGSPPKRDPLAGLEPGTRSRIAQLVVNLGKRGIKVRIGRTLSTIAQEQAHAKAGRSSISSGITWHVMGRAADIYPIDPKTGQPDMAGKNIALYRALHEEWHKLGGFGLAFKPYPSGPVRILRTASGKTYTDLGHVEYHGPYQSIAQAYAAEKGKAYA